MSRNEKILTVVLALAAFGLAAWLTARWLPHRSAPAKPQSHPPPPSKPAIPQPAPAAALTAARVQELVAQAAVKKFAAACPDGRVVYTSGNVAKLSADGRVWEVTGKFLWTKGVGGRSYGDGASLVAEVDAQTREVPRISRRSTMFTTGAIAARTYGLPVAEDAATRCSITYDLDTLEMTGAQEFSGTVFPPPSDKPARAVAVPPGTKLRAETPPAPAPPGVVEVF